ncbi:hypothetical protein HPB48_002703 [Haemaphysalis longicornis]|uniref:ABC transporter domain-containing protein n=1 Tax=Haemaphysalis longicornis TaxID=44386 RepID=A0A9J6GFQ9_HAELO|nr:hypothetical protein HPB48_002703 [Haemaphysalis longicornis]
MNHDYVRLRRAILHDRIHSCPENEAGAETVMRYAQFRRYVGYCPQRDGLLDTLTGVETVSFYCRLRGIAPTAEYLAAVLEVFGIDEVADRPVGTYSLCSRRKLSLCIAVLGVPQVLLLDDPYASVAPSSRRHIVNYITEIQKGRQMSILLSSHSLLDVAFTCDRIAVLAGGRLQCLGSVARLKGRFARSITIVIRTSRDHGDDQENQRNVTRAVKKVIADACLVHACEGTLEFRVPSAQPPVWSDLFTQMGRLKRRFRFPEFSLADTPLENVLLAGPEGSPEMNGGATPNIAGPLPPGTAPLGLSAMTVGAGARRTSIVQHTTQTLDVDARWSAKESIHSQKSTTKLQ